MDCCISSDSDYFLLDMGIDMEVLLIILGVCPFIAAIAGGGDDPNDHTDGNFD